MKSSYKIKYILLGMGLCWGISSASNASAQTQGLADSSTNVPEEFSFDSNSWREIFVDTQLQGLIEQGLTHNTDLNVARLRIDQAEATLKSARLANLPSLAFSPNAGISSFGGEKAVKTYAFPLQASWQIDLFGRLRNAKMQSKMLVESSKAYQQAVQVNLIASIAREYYTCALLHSQLSLANQSVDVWNETVRAMKVFMEEGQYTDAAVSQAEASREQVKATALDLEQQIRESMNAIKILVGDSTSAVTVAFETGDFDENRKQLQSASKSIEESLKTGIQLSRLSARPDVRQAEMNFAASIYAVKEARAAFYPSFTLSGTMGWTNSSGIIVNPGKMLFEAIVSLAQPIFQNGRLKADLKIKRSQQEEARLQFQQTLLNAGIEVNNALTQVQAYDAKSVLLDNQVKFLERAVNSTRLLQQNGSSNYLEVLTAQENLLSVKMSALQNEFMKTASIIALYQAIL